ncbi:MAG: hypothetical protein WKF97_08300 [Chitinophagaceae bacterium]
MTTMMSNVIDYTSEGFMVPYERDDSRCYVSINAQMYCDEDGLAPTGSYFVYCLHPHKGSCYFTVEHDHDLSKWITTDAPSFIEHRFIAWIGEKIDERKMVSISETV